jgi:MFS family permease
MNATNSSKLAHAADTSTDRPLPNPSESGRYFYGWVMLGVAAMATFMSGAGQSYSMAAFVGPMVADLGIERSRYSLSYLVATLVSGATLPWLGKLLDRSGARVMLPLLALTLGFACLGMASVTGIVGLSFWLIAVRTLGQGALTLVSTWLVGQWFERRRGLALGLLGIAGSLSFMIFPAVNLAMIDRHGWRGAWTGLAYAGWVLLLIPALLFLRDRPAKGTADRVHVPHEGASDSTSGEKPRFHAAWTRKEACRTAAFWKIIAPVATMALVGTGLVFHQVSILEDRGVSASGSVALLSLQAAFGAVAAFLAGYLSKYYSPYRMLSLSMAFMAVATFLLLLPGSTILVVSYSVLLGISGGILRTASSQSLLTAFGHSHFGAINGIAMALMVGSAALGPLPLAIAKDMMGHYDTMLAAMVLLPIASGVAVHSTRMPRHPSEAQLGIDIE